jgi:hypothetical protein
LHTTYAHLRAVLHYDAALIYLWDQASGEWVCEPTPQTARHLHELTADQSAMLVNLLEQAAVDLKPIVFTLTEATFPSQRKLLERNYLSACAVMPLHNQQFMQGALVIVNKSGSEWKLESLDVKVLSALVGTINLALDRARPVVAVQA